MRLFFSCSDELELDHTSDLQENYWTISIQWVYVIHVAIIAVCMGLAEIFVLSRPMPATLDPERTTVRPRRDSSTSREGLAACPAGELEQGGKLGDDSKAKLSSDKACRLESASNPITAPAESASSQTPAPKYDSEKETKRLMSSERNVTLAALTKAFHMYSCSALSAIP